MVFYRLLLGSWSLHLLRSGRVFVSCSFSKAEPLKTRVTVAGHVAVMLANLMCKCSLKVCTCSHQLCWLQRSTQESYTPSFWVLLVSDRSEGEVSSGVLFWDMSLLFILAKVFTRPIQPQLPYPHAWEFLVEKEHVLAAKEPEVEICESV